MDVSISNKSSKIITLREIISRKIQMRQLEKDVKDLIVKAFPEGSEVKWKHGRYVQTGIVTGFGYGEHLHVLNNRTNKNVRIQIFDVIGAYGLMDELFPEFGKSGPDGVRL